MREDFSVGLSFHSFFFFYICAKGHFDIDFHFSLLGVNSTCQARKAINIFRLMIRTLMEDLF